MLNRLLIGQNHDITSVESLRDLLTSYIADHSPNELYGNQLSESDIVLFLDILFLCQINEPTTSPKNSRPRWNNWIRKISRHHQLWPTQLELDLRKPDDIGDPDIGGGFADVYKVTLPGTNEDVAVKVVRMYYEEQQPKVMRVRWLIDLIKPSLFILLVGILSRSYALAFTGSS